MFRARICKRLWSPGIDSGESTPLSLCSLAGRYDKKGCLTGPPGWESIPGHLKRSTDTGFNPTAVRPVCPLHSLDAYAATSIDFPQPLMYFLACIPPPLSQPMVFFWIHILKHISEVLKVFIYKWNLQLPQQHIIHNPKLSLFLFFILPLLSLPSFLGLWRPPEAKVTVPLTLALLNLLQGKV